MASNSNSGQKFISRNRKPRVHITYEDPYDSEKLVELPFVMGVMADLSGNASAVAKPDMNDRKFLDIDMDNFDKRMAAIEPAVSMKVAQQARRRRGRRQAVGQSQVHEDGRFLAGGDRPPGAGDWPSCSRRASSSRICCATWTARSPPRTRSRSCSPIPDLMAAMKHEARAEAGGGGAA